MEKMLKTYRSCQPQTTCSASYLLKQCTMHVSLFLSVYVGSVFM